MRLIDADELIEHMFLGTEYDSTVDDGMEKTEAMCKAFKCGWNDALASVMDYAPTVDAEPVRHGHWIAHGKAFMGATIEACSECGELLCGYNKAYCPNCGAKMDEVKENG